MSFFDPSVRVPLIMTGPGVATGTATNACSLIDLLPTFLEIAGADPKACAPEVEGRSLMPLARGEADGTDEAIAEYCAEMTGHPIFMIRRGRFKYIHCDSDPALLFDLENDPNELVNLVGDPAYKDVAADFAREISGRWDSAAIRDQVIASQQARFTVDRAMQVGSGQHWDFNPPRDASNDYVRNHIDWTEAAKRQRFPPLEE